MLTLHDAALLFEKHYYGGRGVEILTNEANGRLDAPAEAHDAIHLIASGILDDYAFDKQIENKDDLQSRFLAVENAGEVNALVGIKAELLQALYYSVFSNSTPPTTLEISYNLGQYVTTLHNLFHDYMWNRNARAESTYSHIPVVDTLLKSYRSDNLSFISWDEIEQHIKRAQALKQQLMKNHPKCFYEGKALVNKLLKLDVKELALQKEPATSIHLNELEVDSALCLNERER